MRDKHQSVASRKRPAWDQNHNPGLCPDRESNQRPFGLRGDAYPTPVRARFAIFISSASPASTTPLLAELTQVHPTVRNIRARGGPTCRGWGCLWPHAGAGSPAWAPMPGPRLELRVSVSCYTVAFAQGTSCPTRLLRKPQGAFLRTSGSCCSSRRTWQEPWQPEQGSGSSSAAWKPGDLAGRHGHPTLCGTSRRHLAPCGLCLRGAPPSLAFRLLVG